jgi:hypothetical protein
VIFHIRLLGREGTRSVVFAIAALMAVSIAIPISTVGASQRTNNASYAKHSKKHKKRKKHKKSHAKSAPRVVVKPPPPPSPPTPPPAPAPAPTPPPPPPTTNLISVAPATPRQTDPIEVTVRNPSPLPLSGQEYRVKVIAPSNNGQSCATFGYSSFFLGPLETAGFVKTVYPGEEGFSNPEFPTTSIWCPGAAQVQLSLRNSEAPSFEDGQILATSPFSIS